MKGTGMFLQKPLARQWGFIALAFVLGLAAGNGWSTAEAINGSGQWWQRECHSKIVDHVELQKTLDGKFGN